MNEEIANIPLRDIHLPGTVNWWPLAPGWWILLAIAIVLAVVSYFVRKHHKQNAMKKLALSSLREIKQAYIKSSDSTEFVKNLSLLLRKICITFYSREATAGLTGKRWLMFLDDTMDIDNKKIGLRFNSPIGAALTQVPFQPDYSKQKKIDVEQLYDLSEAWINSLPVYQTLNNLTIRK